MLVLKYHIFLNSYAKKEKYIGISVVHIFSYILTDCCCLFRKRSVNNKSNVLLREKNTNYIILQFCDKDTNKEPFVGFECTLNVCKREMFKGAF